MKDIFLKIAKVNDIESFYALFPDEASFMKKHGKAFRKAQMGLSTTAINGVNDAISYSNSIFPLKEDPVAAWSSIDESKYKFTPYSSISGGDIGEMPEYNNSPIKPMQSKSFPASQPQLTQRVTNTTEEGNPEFWNNLSELPMGPLTQSLIKGIGAIKEQKKQLKKAKQFSQLTDLQLKASSLPTEQPHRKYLRPEDVTNTGEEFFPIYGVGTNVLAKKGKKIKKAQDGWSSFIESGASDQLFDFGNKLGTTLVNPNGQPDAGSMLGGGVGETAGKVATMLTGIPGLDKVGKFAGTTIGGLVDRSDVKRQKYDRRTKSNIGKMAFINAYGGLKDQNTSFMKEGGNLSSMDGQLQTHWGGYSEDISVNPYLPNGGETIEFKGNKHTEGTKGKRGIGITYSGNPVEVEDGEPAIELPDGDETSLIIFGDRKIPSMFASMLGDNKAKNKKFKNYIKTLSEDENKQMNKMTSSQSKLADLQISSPYDELELNSHYANIIGSDMKLKSIAEKKQKAAALQEILNMADGNNNGTAQKGKIIYSDSKKNEAFWQWYSPSQMKGDPTKFKGQFERLVWNPKVNEEKERQYNADKGLYRKYISDHYITGGLTYDEWKKNIHHYGIEGAQSPEYKKWLNKSKPTAKTQASVKTNDNELPIIDVEEGTFDNTSPVAKSTPSAKTKASSPTVSTNANNPYGLKVWEGNKDGKYKGNASTYSLEEWTQIAKNLGFKGKGNKDFQQFLLTNPATKDIVTANHKKIYNRDPFIDDKLGAGWGAPELKTIGTKQGDVPIMKGRGIDSSYLDAFKSSALKSMKKKVPLPPFPEEEEGYPWEQMIQGVASEILPYVIPSDVEDLNAWQLLGETYALANNQIDPVQAQLYHPQLDVPYDISLQDQLNENVATFRSAQRLAQGNPAAQAILNSQMYEANQNVLGNQFRLNQEMKNNVYSKNRDVLNDAQMKNLAIFDTQYQRQAEAKANTKATTLEALKSIGDKMLRNQLENRTLATYENLYNYRFDPRFRAWNINAPAMFDVNGGFGPTMNLEEGKEYLYNEDDDVAGVRTKKKSKKTESRNGSIVKAIKNL